MKLINKSSVIGFIIGSIISPIIIFGSFYLLIENMMGDKKTNFPPPDIPLESQVNMDWIVKTIDGETLHMGEKSADKILIINFWATWCPPCVAEMPSIEKLYLRFRDKVEFACISQEPIDTMIKFRDKHKYNLPMYHIQTSPPFEFQTGSIPVTFIISKDKKMVLKHAGGADWGHEKVVNYIEELLLK